MDIKNKIILTAGLFTMAFISNGWAQSIIGGFGTTLSLTAGDDGTYILTGTDGPPSNLNWSCTGGCSIVSTNDATASVTIAADINDCVLTELELSVTFTDSSGTDEASTPIDIDNSPLNINGFRLTPVTAVTGTSATLHWTIVGAPCSGIVSFIAIDPKTTFNGSQAINSPTATSLTLTGLQGCSSYKVSLEAISIGGDTYDSFNSVTFTTPFAPPAPPPSTNPGSITRRSSEVLPAGSDSTIIAVNTINLFSGFSVTTNNSANSNSLIVFEVTGSGAVYSSADTTCTKITPRSISDASVLPPPTPDKPLTLTNKLIQPTTRTILMYPNPTSTGQFNVQINNAPSTTSSVITISNMLGSAIYSNTFTGTTITVPLPAVEPGVYLVSIKNGTTNLVQKLVVQ